jgi:hypothetical protein
MHDAWRIFMREPFGDRVPLNLLNISGSVLPSSELGWPISQAGWPIPQKAGLFGQAGCILRRRLTPEFGC